MTRPAKPSLPCAARKSHGKGFAVRVSFAVRWAGFAVWYSLPCGFAVCRAAFFAVRFTSNVRFASTPHGKSSTA
jgi:hypothetical protein